MPDSPILNTTSAPRSLEPLVDWLADQYEQSKLWFGHGTTSADDEAAWTISAALALDLDDFEATRPVQDTELTAIAELATRRIETRQPLAYLIGEAWFAGKSYAVDERVIIPRSHLGEWIPDQFAPWISADNITRIIDIGTGSGCIAIALAYAFPQAIVDASDLSAEALDVAQQNVERHDMTGRVRLHEADLFPEGDQQWDLIVTNPPYVDDATMSDLPAEYHFEPDMAFRGGADGLDIIERLVAGAQQRLAPGGHFIIEAGTARLAMEAAWPDTAMMWLATSSGEDGIALLDYDALMGMTRRA